MPKFYAVRVGRSPGVYTTWDECRAEVHKHSGAVFKSFKSLAEAEEFVAQSDGRPEAKDKQAGTLNEGLPEPGAPWANRVGVLERPAGASLM